MVFECSFCELQYFLYSKTETDGKKNELNNLSEQLKRKKRAATQSLRTYKSHS